jgi:hypothetical protein
MTRTKISLFRMALGTVVGAGCLFGSEQISITKLGSFITEAHAIIGRPLTPMSYAGVARRTTARAYGAYGVYGAPVVVAPVMVAPMAVRPVCMQVVNAYGQIATVCR